MQRRPNKGVKQNKGTSNLKLIILFILDFILGLIIGLGATIFSLMDKINDIDQYINYVNQATHTTISNTQPSGIYVLAGYAAVNDNIKNFNFIKLNQRDVNFHLLGDEYPRVYEVYPYSTNVYFNIEFSGNNLISREMINPKDGTSLGNNISDIDWIKYLTGSFSNISEFETLYSYSNDAILIYNDTKESTELVIKDGEGHNRDKIYLLPGEYYITRPTLFGYTVNKLNQ